MEHKISENTILQHPLSTEEKSKQRAAELKKLANEISRTENSSGSLPEQQRITMECQIVEELNRTLAIVHTSSTYILIEKSETEFVLDSKGSLLILYENQPVPELAAKNAKKSPTKAHIW